MARSNRPRSIAAIERGAVLIAILAALSGTASAQSAEAEQLFRDGDRLMAEGKTSDACDAFDGSNRIEPRAGTLIRLGECREKNQQLASAWSAYTDALVRVKDPKKRGVAQAAVKALEPRLSKLTIHVAARVDGITVTRNGKPVDAALWERAVPTDGGEQIIVASAPGFASTTVTVMLPMERGAVAANIPALEKSTAVEPAPPSPPVVVTEPKPLPPPVVVAASPSSFTAKRKVAVVLAVVGVGAIAGGGFLGVSANKREDDAFALCPEPSTPCANSAAATDKLDSAHSRALLANVAFGVGGAAIIGAAVLWLTGAPHVESHGMAVIPQVSGSTTGLAIGGRF